MQSVLWTTLFSYPLGIIYTAGITTIPTAVSKAIIAGKSLPSIVGIVQSSLIQAIIPGMAGALLLGFLQGGGQACVQHLCLRLVLTCSEGKIPWNYARFLNYCAERRLLHRIGGRYRFVHRELLDHFALKYHG